MISLSSLIISFFLSGCGYQEISSKKYENINKPYAIATFTVLADMASNVAGERYEVKSITKPGAEIHTYQFTPSDILRAKGAQLVIENGLGLEMWIQKFIASAGNIPRVVLSEGIEPLLIEGDVYAGKPNPHAWMSPRRAMHYVDKIAEAFIRIDPDGFETYNKNALQYKQKLLDLDKELKSYISTIPSDQRVLVTCEGAFSYLAQDYGLEEAYLWPVNSESQITPRRMSKLISLIKEKAVPTIFCESTVSSQAQEQVAKESGASFGGNFFVDSLSDENGPAPTLLELQRYNVRLIKKGLASGLEED